MLKDRIFKNFFFLFVVIFILFVFLEIFLRILGITDINKHACYLDSPLPIAKIADNKELGFELIPNYKGIEELHIEGKVDSRYTIDINLNAQGFRDSDFSFTKPKNTKRIICLGDSFTIGTGVDSKKIYPKVLETLLDNDKRYNYEVYNMGVHRYNTCQETALLELKGLQYHPDIVTLGFVLNDAQIQFIKEDNLTIKFTAYKDIEVRKNNLSFILLPNNFKKYLRKHLYIYNFLSSRYNILLERIGIREKRFAFKSFLLEDYGSDWLSAEKAFLKLFDICKKNNIKLIVLFFPSLESNKRLEKDVELVKSLCDENKISFIDLYETFSKYDMKKLRNHKLESHPNSLAHKLTAEQLYNAISKLD